MGIYVVIFIFGAVVGSFLNVCIYRIPLHKSIVFPHSHCASCGKPIKFYDNIPILSYFILKGRCRQCKSKYSFRYPAIEALNAALYVFVALHFGLTAQTLFYFAMVSTLVVIFFIDLDHMIIPDVITIPGAAISFAVGSFLLPDPISRGKLGLAGSAAGLLVGFFSFWLIAVLGRIIFKKDAMGGGDIKLMTMVGAFLGWKGVLLTTFAASVSGVLVSLPMSFYERMKKIKRYSITESALESMKSLALPSSVRKKLKPLENKTFHGEVELLDSLRATLGNEKTETYSAIILDCSREVKRIPFGPFLATGAVLTLFWGKEIVDFYWRLVELVHD